MGVKIGPPRLRLGVADESLSHANRPTLYRRGLARPYRGVGDWYKNKVGRVVTKAPFRLADSRAMTPERNDYLIV
jgi:hypothetical protein